jgi:hypothetical protein
MKITSQDFETLRGMIEPVLARVPVAEYRKANPTFSDKRVRWDYFHVAGRPALSFLCDTLYKYMNDTHMGHSTQSNCRSVAVNQSALPQGLNQ